MTWSITPSQLQGTAFRASPDGTGFTIDIPATANIASDMVTCHATGPKADHVAVVFEDAGGELLRFTYRDLERQATQAAVALKRIGIRRGDRVAIHSVQRPETIIAHLATYKLGAIATTISQLTGPDAMAHILTDSGARAMFTHNDCWQRFRSERNSYQDLQQVIVAGPAADGEIAFTDCLTGEPGEFRPLATTSEDPTLLIYTSGSTGLPKG
ncbi:MAG: AMP-binding protein, partial [Aestuariivirgaceae bacterium]